jgi:hypothetical protein
MVDITFFQQKEQHHNCSYHTQLRDKLFCLPTPTKKGLSYITPPATHPLLPFTNTSDHLFLHCRYATSIWGARRIAHGTSPYNHWHQKRRALHSEDSRKEWDSECMAIYWNLWKERNKRIFQAKELPTQELQLCIQEDIRRWNKN